MASNRQIEANRTNAKRSTGPKTRRGKAKSSRNALRHGLARSGNRDEADVARLAGVISSGLEHPGAAPMIVDLARCKVELLRVRAVRQDILAALLQGPVAVCAKRVQGLERYERAALVRQKRALRSLRSEGV